jgi:hypothetical protein
MASLGGFKMNQPNANYNPKIPGDLALSSQAHWENPIAHTLLLGNNDSSTAGYLRNGLSNGHARVVARDGISDGIRFFNPERCHLVVIDRAIGPGDAIRAARGIRDSYGSDVPIVMASAARYDAETLRELDELGVRSARGSSTLINLAENLIQTYQPLK